MERSSTKVITGYYVGVCLGVDVYLLVYMKYDQLVSMTPGKVLGQVILSSLWQSAFVLRVDMAVARIALRRSFVPNSSLRKDMPFFLQTALAKSTAPTISFFRFQNIFEDKKSRFLMFSPPSESKEKAE